MTSMNVLLPGNMKNKDKLSLSLMNKRLLLFFLLFFFSLKLKLGQIVLTPHMV